MGSRPTPDNKPAPTPSKKSGSAAGPVIGILCALGVVVGGAYFVKRRRDGTAMSAAYRYQPQRDSEDATELFSGMSVNKGSFQPVSVPQTHNI